jgi:hypothetical protein
MTDQQYEILVAKIAQIESRLDSFTPPTATLQERWSPQQVAARYGIKCTQTVIEWIKAGKVTATKDEFSKRWIIPVSEVLALDRTGGKPLGRN